MTQSRNRSIEELTDVCQESIRASSEARLLILRIHDALVQIRIPGYIEAFNDQPSVRESSNDGFGHNMGCALRSLVKRVGYEKLKGGVQLAVRGAKPMDEDLLSVVTSVVFKSRTQLNTVLGMIDLALDTELSPEQRQYLEAAKEASQALLALTNDLTRAASRDH